MRKMQYSAGMVSKPFWFLEFKKVIRLLYEGRSFDEIKAMSTEENLFGVSKTYRAKEIFNGVTIRAKPFDADMIEIFCTSDLATTKIMALIAVMKTDKLFFDFLYEVYREKIIIGTLELNDSDISIFFNNKQRHDDSVAKWKEYTLKKLRNSYQNYMRDAGLLSERNEITPPLLDVTLERYLSSHNMNDYVKALTGVR
jgi:hypothetical protein